MYYKKHYELIEQNIQERSNFFVLFCINLQSKFGINTSEMRNTFLNSYYDCFSISIKEDIINIILYNHKLNTKECTTYKGFSFYPKEGQKFTLDR